MLGEFWVRIADSVAACWVNVRSRNLRLAQSAFGLMWAGDWAATVAIGVIAFEGGGAEAVGAMAFARMVPAAFVAPMAATVADRTRRERVLAGVGVIRAASLAAAAAASASGQSIVVVGAAVVAATVAQTLFRPAHSALLPTLCSAPNELTSANVVRGMLDSLAMLVGPLCAAALIAISGPSAVLLVAAAMSAVAGALAIRISYEPPPRIAAPPRATPFAEAVKGIRAIAGDRAVALLTALTTLQTFTRGALTVFSVVVAISLLGAGTAGVGLLTAAVGVGALVGSLSATLLVGRGSLARWFGIGVALWGGPLVVIGLIAQTWSAILMLAIVGIGNALVDVGVFTLLARLADDVILARVYAAFEGVITLGVAAGAILAPALIAAAGIRVALMAIGALTPIAVLVSWQALLRLDRRVTVRDADIAMLQRLPMLRPLPQATIEYLAAALARVAAPAGSLVCEQGQVGDHFYVIENGDAEVLRDGRPLAALGPGNSFGEIALIRDCRRTATIRATTDLTLRTLTRMVFVTAVAGYIPSAESADQIITEHLSSYATTQAEPAGISASGQAPLPRR